MFLRDPQLQYVHGDTMTGRPGPTGRTGDAAAGFVRPGPDVPLNHCAFPETRRSITQRAETRTDESVEEVLGSGASRQCQKAETICAFV